MLRDAKDYWQPKSVTVDGNMVEVTVEDRDEAVLKLQRIEQQIAASKTSLLPRNTLLHSPRSSIKNLFAFFGSGFQYHHFVIEYRLKIELYPAILDSGRTVLLRDQYL